MNRIVLILFVAVYVPAFGAAPLVAQEPKVPVPCSASDPKGSGLCRQTTAESLAEAGPERPEGDGDER
jgi:hypothetical protein